MREEASPPTSDNDREGWATYWAAQGMPWRTEPEIPEERQRFLAERRAVTPDSGQDIYPFKGIKLDRADVEWLLATHESGGMAGPVDWHDAKQRNRVGIDVSRADLRDANLTLPLAKADFTEAQLDRAFFFEAHLEEASFYRATMPNATFTDAQLQGANLTGAHMVGADFGRANMREAYLGDSDLRKADLAFSHLEGAYLEEARLSGADLRRATLDAASNLDFVLPGDAENGFFCVADVIWGGAILSAINWSLRESRRDPIRINRHIVLGDEVLARNPPPVARRKAGLPSDDEAAIRAYRQLAIELRASGESNQADEFAYSAQVFRRSVLLKRRQIPAYSFSLFLAALTGYGYRFGRIFAAYVLVVLSFAAIFLVGHLLRTHTLRAQDVLDAIVTSLQAFHQQAFGNIFTLGGFVTFIEAVSGLIIESTFIAMLVQRLLVGAGS